jgi:hypothetical protein
MDLLLALLVGERIVRMAKAKGHSPWRYAALTIALILGGELPLAAVGVLLDLGVGAALLGLLGAGGGAAAALAIAKRLPERTLASSAFA